MAKKQILVVEDHPELFNLVSILLTSRGYNVKGVTDGQTALDYIANQPTDLVLLDIMLPGIDGFEVCRQIKRNESTQHVPVIILTAKNTRVDFAKGEEVGADWYITKPFKSAVLMEAIQRFISGTEVTAPCYS